MPDHPNGGASIREVHRLLKETEGELRDALKETEQRLASQLADHQRDHDRMGRRGWRLASTLLTAVGILASLSVGVLALMIR